MKGTQKNVLRKNLKKFGTR